MQKLREIAGKIGSFFSKAEGVVDVKPSELPRTYRADLSPDTVRTSVSSEDDLLSDDAVKRMRVDFAGQPCRYVQPNAMQRNVAQNDSRSDYFQRAYEPDKHRDSGVALNRTGLDSRRAVVANLAREDSLVHPTRSQRTSNQGIERDFQPERPSLRSNAREPTQRLTHHAQPTYDFEVTRNQDRHLRPQNKVLKRSDPHLSISFSEETCLSLKRFPQIPPVITLEHIPSPAQAET